ncbi:AroB-related putative sugar phosphate phospholyase (cyclizing) [Thermodesulfobacteriota bacterium]
MSDNFTVHSAVHDYTVNFVDDCIAPLTDVMNSSDLLLIDAQVISLHESRLQSILDKFPHIVIQATEEKKSYIELVPIFEKLIQQGFRKNNKIVAIGGGITQDIATFIAANIYRGVEWYFFPTTLLAQADSCIGGKASINFGAYKNLLGNFYPPRKIFIDLSFLDTLPRKEMVSGLGEMTHFYFVSGRKDFELMRQSYTKSFEDKKLLETLIHRNLSIKKATIEIDEFDRKERLVFNYGHSFGHAIESVTGYRVPHGIAVSHGMDIANYVSMKMGLIDENQYTEMRQVLKFNWEEIPLGEIDLDAFINALRKDKKNIGSETRVILTRGLGDMFITSIDIDGQAQEWIREYFAL